MAQSFSLMSSLKGHPLLSCTCRPSSLPCSRNVGIWAVHLAVGVGVCGRDEVWKGG